MARHQIGFELPRFALKADGDRKCALRCLARSISSALTACVNCTYHKYVSILKGTSLRLTKVFYSHDLACVGQRLLRMLKVEGGKP